MWATPPLWLCPKRLTHLQAPDPYKQEQPLNPGPAGETEVFVQRWSEEIRGVARPVREQS